MRHVVFALLGAVVFVSGAIVTPETIPLDDVAASNVTGGGGNIANSACIVQTTCNVWNEVFDVIDNPFCSSSGSCERCTKGSVGQEGCQGGFTTSCSYLEDADCGKIQTGTCAGGDCANLQTTQYDCDDVPQCATFVGC